VLLNEILAIMARDTLPKREDLTVKPSDANESLRAYQSVGGLITPRIVYVHIIECVGLYTFLAL
jgi:hypothetical protein